MGFFQNADPLVLVAFIGYLAIMLAIGFYFSNKSKNMNPYSSLFLYCLRKQDISFGIFSSFFSIKT